MVLESCLLRCQGLEGTVAFKALFISLFSFSAAVVRRWLQAMHQAALERVVPIQFCMALPSDLMASLELPNVQQLT